MRSFDRHGITAYIAADTLGPVADRIEKILSHDRRLVRIERWATDDPRLDISVGLAVNEIKRDATSLRIDFKRGVDEIHLYCATGSTENEARHRWNTRQGFRMKVRVEGWGTEPWRDDRIDIDTVNTHGVIRRVSYVFQADWD